MTATAADVAMHLLARFNAGGGHLSQEDAADEIERKFGRPWVYENENGNLAISKDVLTAFRKVTPDAVWDRSEKAWRRREGWEDAKKRQAD